MDGLIVEMVLSVKGKLPQYRVIAFGNKWSGDETILFRKNAFIPLNITNAFALDHNTHIVSGSYFTAQF